MDAFKAFIEWLKYLFAEVLKLVAEFGELMPSDETTTA